MEASEKGKGLPAKVIDCLRKAKIRLPDSDELSITLARTLLDRFRVCIAYSNDDYEEGTTALDKILSSHAPGNEPSQYREALRLISLFAQVRLAASWMPDHLEEAIYRFRNWLPWIPHEDPIRPDVIDFLTYLQSMHFEDFGVWSLQEGHSYVSVCSGRPSFWDLVASLGSPSMATEFQRLSILLSALRMTDMAEIEEAIEPCRLLLASFHPRDMCRSAAVWALCVIASSSSMPFGLQITSNTSTRQFSILRESQLA